MITGWGSIALAVEGMKLGAADFINKPWDDADLIKAIRTALALIQHTDPKPTGREKLDQQYHFGDIIGESPEIIDTLDTIARVCETDASVLILGQSGTGKEMIAEAVHHNSVRKKEAFVKVNLGGISTSLLKVKCLVT